MNRYNETGKGVAPLFPATRLLDQLREQIRCLHYNFQTEKASPQWARFFVRWRSRAQMMRHPRDMGQAEVEAVGTASSLDALAAFGMSPAYYAFDS